MPFWLSGGKEMQIMTTDEKTRPVTDYFEQALRNYEQALKAGLKMQEESTRVWTSLLNQSSAPQDWQKRAKTVAEETVAQAQKAVDDGLKVIEQNSRTSVELLKKAVATAQASSVQEAQTRLVSFWEGSLNAMRDSALAVTQASNRALESWAAYVRKNSDGATATAGAKA
jgi:hypothetical protein